MPLDRERVFRIDDVSINTDAKKLEQMIMWLQDKFDGCRIILAVSPAVSDMSACEQELNRERVFSAMLHVENDFRVFYKMEKVGVPSYLDDFKRNYSVELAAHGMVHVDHRLLKKSAQELSIVMSCALVRSRWFVPPFHKWDDRTETICAVNGIQILKTDRNCRHLGLQAFDPRFEWHYFHTHDFTFDTFCGRFLRPVD